MLTHRQKVFGVVLFSVLLFVLSCRPPQVRDAFTAVPDDRKFPTYRTIDHPGYRAKLKCFANPTDIVCATILDGRIWEKNLFERGFRPHIRPGTTVLDCGAYVGSHTLLMSQVDPSVQVLAFEMMPEHYKLVQDNIRLNRLSNVLAFHCALSDHNGKVRIPEVDYQKTEQVNYGGTRLADAAKTESDVFVPCMTLDAFLPWITQPLSFVKMDVEGHELAVLRGAMQLCNLYRPVIAVEIWKDRYAEFIASDVWTHLSKRLGYRIEPLSGHDYLLVVQ